MANVTKSPTVAADVGSVPWVDLQNIASTDGSFAYSVNTAGGMCVVFPTTDGITPNTGGCSYGASACNAHYIEKVGTDYYPNPTGGNTDMWSITLTPEQVNSPNFGFVVWTPGGSFVAKGFNFGLLRGDVVRGIKVGFNYNPVGAWSGSQPWAYCEYPPGTSYYACNQHKISGFYAIIYYTPAEPCTIGSTTCANGGQYICPDGGWVLQGPCPGTECTAGQTKCAGGNKYTCNNGNWENKGIDSACSGTECPYTGAMECIGGHLYYCNNGYRQDMGTTTTCVCVTGSQKCEGGHKYTCDGVGHWIDQGVSVACPGSECTAGQTNCSNGHFFNCNNGRWADQGLDSICPGTGCTGSVSRCADGNRFACENGYEVDKGPDSSCCTPSGSTRCIGGNRQTCGTDGLWNTGVVDSTCNTNPPPVQNEYSSLLWIVAGIAAIGGGYYLYSRGEKKRSKNVK
jgi:hypothetical protein